MQEKNNDGAIMDHARVWGMLRVRLSQVPLDRRRSWKKPDLQEWWHDLLTTNDFKSYDRLDFVTVTNYCKGLFGSTAVH
jgi:hypothetical protein